MGRRSSEFLHNEKNTKCVGKLDVLVRKKVQKVKVSLDFLLKKVHI